MSIFDSIKNAIFRPKSVSPAKPTTSNAPRSAGASPASPPTAAGPANASASSQPVDVEAVLESLAAKNSQSLNWRTSIVDLMKLLDLDSSLTHRTALAKELGYTGDTADSAAMNIWLHQQVMKKLAEHGGKVPETLRH